MIERQFIGYWGITGQTEPHSSPAILPATILAKITPNIRQGENWGVGHLGAGFTNTIKQNKNIIAAISASGLVDRPDAWVRIEGDRLILGREPFGRVPLYWAKVEEIIWFSSRFQLLLPIIHSQQVSIPGLYGYCAFSYVPTPLTPVSDIFIVPAGKEEIFTIEEQNGGNTGVHIGASIHHPLPLQDPWQEMPQQIDDENQAISQLQTLLKNSINRQITDLPSEPVGVFLSGGLDSSTVAALLVQAGVKVRAYTLDFGEEYAPEWPYAEQVANFLNIPLVKVPATPRQIKKALVKTVKALDLPFGDGVTVPLYLLAAPASQETSVIFNGEGGDQLFAGWTNKPIIAASIYNQEHPGGQQDFIGHYLRTFHRLLGYESRVFQPDVYAQVQDIQPEDWLKDALDPAYCNEILHRLRRATLMLKGAQNIHPRATNLAWPHGLVVRSPFCDLPLAQWTFQLSGELCLRGSCEKYILKKAVESWLPPEIVWREKRGMGVPLTQWCLNELWPEIRHWLNPGILQSEGRFIPDIVKQVICGNLGGQIRGRRIGEILWLLLIWQVWRTTVLGEVATGKSIYNNLWLPPTWLRQLDSWQNDFR
jgi:asparagine synthase (glutamine-hydrolysing)